MALFGSDCVVSEVKEGQGEELRRKGRLYKQFLYIVYLVTTWKQALWIQVGSRRGLSTLLGRRDRGHVFPAEVHLPRHSCLAPQGTLSLFKSVVSSPRSLPIKQVWN